MFNGDLIEGELEIGQVSAMIKEVMPVVDIMSQIIEGFEKAVKTGSTFKL
jgi:enoyl-[acyl-carrier protein] reductase II